jgi:hypothetical protein
MGIARCCWDYDLPTVGRDPQGRTLQNQITTNGLLPVGIFNLDPFLIQAKPESDGSKLKNPMLRHRV